MLFKGESLEELPEPDTQEDEDDPDVIKIELLPNGEYFVVYEIGELSDAAYANIFALLTPQGVENLYETMSDEHPDLATDLLAKYLLFHKANSPKGIPVVSPLDVLGTKDEDDED